MIHQDSGGCGSRATVLQQLGRLSRRLSQIFRGKSTTISPQQRNTLTLRLVLQHSLLWARLAHKFGVAAAESLRQQVPTQVHGFRASNPGFGCTAHSMIACSLWVSCVPSLLRANFSGLLLSFRGAIADLSLTHVLHYIKNPFCIHLKTRTLRSMLRCVYI